MAGREIEKGCRYRAPSYRYGSISETLFMSSRDGISFKRWGEAFIRPGPPQGALDLSRLLSPPAGCW